MSDELKQQETENKECKCVLKSEFFKKVLTIAIGTFVGVYCALSLFAAVHRPPMMPPHAFGPHGGFRNGCPCKMIHHHHFNKAHRPDKGVFQGQPAPFEAQRPQAGK